VIFTDRERAGEVRFGAPTAVAPDDEDLARALEVLGIRVPT
jgi:hypothetical protein